ncbi:MAG: phosphate/phosphite/phosphonate ABC transporter substrate-binding protein [Desulfobulbaceae bacterium]|nr:phosphate/phosphite/phosphonate ABC transporter substrate-binding protein [Desulfobulbaceae bacterium]
MKKACCSICTALFFLVSVLPGYSEEADREYIFSVVPQFPATTIQNNWKPLLDEVVRVTGYKIGLKFYKSIPEFEQGFLEGVPDFAYMNPYHQVMAAKAQGYIPLIRDSKELEGLLVVRKDDTIGSVQELNGKELAFPSPNALAASLYMRALLVGLEHVNFTPNYVKTHSNVYRHVLLGKAAAGGGVNKTLQDEPKELREQLRILYKTPGISSHPISVHPRVSSNVAKAISEAFIKLAGDPHGRELLREVAIPEPVMADYEKDYKPLEMLGLEKFDGED